MKHGLTLTSLMVAVALSGVLAVAGTRLVVNQMNTLRVLELKDKGDSIFEFYTNLLHDDKVWWCSLYDYESTITPATAKTVHTPNKAMRDCVLAQVASCDSSGTMRLIGPDCQIKFTEVGTRNFNAGDYRPGTIFIPPREKFLKDSVMTEASGGWWGVKVTWEDKGNRAVDLILTQTLNEERWESAATGKRYLPELQNREFRIRRSTNYVPSNSDTTKAVTKIALHTASRLVSHHNDPLVNTTATPVGLGDCHLRDPKGQVVMSVGSTNACSGNRVAVTPTSCVSRYSVIDRIGSGSGMTAADNVKCALDGRGKLVQYRNCSRVYLTEDRCTVQGQNFTASKYYVPGAITGIGPTGTLICKGVPSWPTVTFRQESAPRSWNYPYTSPTATYNFYGQGGIGHKGPGGRGPTGHRGPAWNDPRCSSS